MKFYLGLSFAILAMGIAGAIFSRMRYKQLRTSMSILVIGVFAGAFCLNYPIYRSCVQNGAIAVPVALYETLRMFLVDGDYTAVLLFTTNIGGLTAQLLRYAVYLYFFLAPLMTAGFILTFLQRIGSVRLVFHWRREIYVFSQLNEKSLNLAKSIQKNQKPDRKAMIAFTEAYTDDSEAGREIRRRAREIKALLLGKEITGVCWDSRWYRFKNVYLFAMDEREEENVRVSVQLKKQYEYNDAFQLYLFASNPESYILFQATAEDGMGIRRIDPARSLIEHNLYENGYRLFDHVKPVPEGEDKVISAVILGLGRYGTEMLKALSWFCQMTGYRLVIHAFDKDEQAESRIRALCPEMLDPRFNRVPLEQRNPREAFYDIYIHSGVDINSWEFQQILSPIEDVSYCFVALGNDGANVGGAVLLRTLRQRKNFRPIIQALMSDSAKKELLRDAHNYKEQPYEIEYIGDIASTYTREAIFDGELNKNALSLHNGREARREPNDKRSWNYEYNFRSSLAAAIHLKMRIYCQIPGIMKKAGEVTKQEKYVLESLEHRRWNAYMRAEGYIYSGSTEYGTRDDLGKMHPDLTEFDKLPDKEKDKDIALAEDLHTEGQ